MMRGLFALVAAGFFTLLLFLLMQTMISNLHPPPEPPLVVNSVALIRALEVAEKVQSNPAAAGPALPESPQVAAEPPPSQPEAAAPSSVPPPPSFAAIAMPEPSPFVVQETPYLGDFEPDPPPPAPKPVPVVEPKPAPKAAVEPKPKSKPTPKPKPAPKPKPKPAPKPAAVAKSEPAPKATEPAAPKPAGSSPTPVASIEPRPSMGGGPAGGADLAPGPVNAEASPLLRVEPVYPRRAARKRTEGWVELSFTIDEQGRVVDPQVVKAKPRRLFDEAALDAIKQWRFKPRLRDGRPVASKALQKFEFKLGGMMRVFRSLLLLCSLIPLVAGADLLSEKTHTALSEVHRLLAAQDYDQALDKLRRLEPRVRGRKHEEAQLWLAYGHVQARRGDDQAAIESLKRSLQADALPADVTAKTRYLLARLQANVGQFQDARQTWERWYRGKPEVDADALRFAAGVYAALGEHAQAAAMLRKVLARSDPPSEPDHRQLLSVYLAAEDTAAALELLQIMVRLFPERAEYWQRLSSLYRQNGDEDRGLATLLLAYRFGVLAGPADLRLLVDYLRYRELPEKAANLLQAALESGRIRADAENWRWLAETWRQAREWRRAVLAYREALALNASPELAVEMAQLLAEQGEWSAVVEILNTDTSPNGEALLLLGRAHYERGDPAAALRCFRAARSFGPSRRQADQWLTYLAAD